MTITLETDRLVVGGGLFGCYAAVVLAERGHDVLLVEQGPDLLTRASSVNQARLHTGLHYPRSILTARESLDHYRAFREKWPSAVRDFPQIYAVAAHNSKTGAQDFAAFIGRLGIATQEIDAEAWFHPNTISRAFQVEEPTFDARVMRTLLHDQLMADPRISVLLDTPVVAGEARDGKVNVSFGSGVRAEADGVVLASYASTNSIRQALGLGPLPLRFELAEVVIGTVSEELKGVGFTVMDGPFWSLMPFGFGDKVSLTSVGLTPLDTAVGQPQFGCQEARLDCTPIALQECSSCLVRPKSAVQHHLQQMAMFLRKASAFSPTHSLLTVKAILTTTDVDDARPTVVLSEAEGRIVTVLSGKVSTLLDLEGTLS